MSRRESRKVLKLESLESRQLLSDGISFANPGASNPEPSNDAQYMLELINQARTNPGQAINNLTETLDKDLRATLDYFRIDLAQERSDISAIQPQQPVAWSATLSRAADSHSRDMADNRFQDHRGSDGSMPTDRIAQAGYASRQADAENVFAYADSIDRAMQAFTIDWGVSNKGHRANLLQSGVSAQDSFQEVGLGLVKTNPTANGGFGPLVVTQNFARQLNSTPTLLGVVYTDRDNDHFYSRGEGEAGATIVIRNINSGEIQRVQTWGSGGYQTRIQSGSYEVTAVVRDQIVRSQRIDVSNENVKADYDLSQPWEGGSPTGLAPAPGPALNLNPVVVPAIPVEPPASAPVISPAPASASSGFSAPTSFALSNDLASSFSNMRPVSFLSSLPVFESLSKMSWRARS